MINKITDYGGMANLMLQQKEEKQIHFALGRHMTIEYYDCDPFVFNNPDNVESIFIDAAQKSGASVVSSCFRSFSPQGVSGMVIISESHFSVHAWPEHNYAAVDIFTCGEVINFNIAVNYLKEALGAERTIISADMNRGIISNNGIEKPVPTAEKHPCSYTLSWRRMFEKYNAWGILASLDIYNCDRSIITSAAGLKGFIGDFCNRFEFKMSGECALTQFCEKSQVCGFNTTQISEDSSISGHFVKTTGTAYLDVLSRKFNDPRELGETATSLLKGNYYKMQVAIRK